jgi:hypothetical protein
MQDGVTVFIDESGEAGIERVRSDSSGGASPYMTLGASLIRNGSRAAIESTITQICSEIGKSAIHCSQLSHYQILHVLRRITQHRMRFFGVISHKKTPGDYKVNISGDSDLYYNKCAQYLLERVGWFMESREIPIEKLDIIFEKANVDYEKMRNLLLKCQKNPMRENTTKLRNICVDKIAVRKKGDEPLLCLADLAAHALYKCVDKNGRNFGIPEPRYLRELAPHFFGHPETRTVVGAGLYCVHSMRDLHLDPDVEAVFGSMTACHG